MKSYIKAKLNRPIGIAFTTIYSLFSFVFRYKHIKLTILISFTPISYCNAYKNIPY